MALAGLGERVEVEASPWQISASHLVKQVPLLQVWKHCFTGDEQVMSQRLSSQSCLHTCASQFMVTTADPNPSSDCAHCRALSEQLMVHVLWKQFCSHLSASHSILAMENKSAFCVQFCTPCKHFKLNFPVRPLCQHVSTEDEQVRSLENVLPLLLHS